MQAAVSEIIGSSLASSVLSKQDSEYVSSSTATIGKVQNDSFSAVMNEQAKK